MNKKEAYLISCRNIERVRQWRKDNPKKYREYNRKYCQDNKKKIVRMQQ